MRGEATGPYPTDRGKLGVKRSLLTEARGIPLVVVVDGANRHDMKLVAATLAQLMATRPAPTPEQPQGLCLDKGYDYHQVAELVSQWGYTVHIRSRGEERKAKTALPGYRARRWVVERSHSWLNRFRALLIRWEKKADNYLGLLHLACSWITFKHAGLFG